MADKVSTSKTVSMVTEYTDGDTRTITQNNPLENTASLVSAINAFNSYVAANQILIGDKASGTYVRIKEAKIIDKTVTTFDIQ